MRLREFLRFHYVWRSYFAEQMYAGAIKLRDTANRFAFRLLAVYTFAIAALIILNGITRTAGYPMPWTGELSHWLLTGVCFIGSSLAVKKGLHVGITILIELAPPLTKRPLVFAGNLLVTAFLISLVGISFAAAAGSFHAAGTSLRIPLALPYLQISLGGILILLQMPPFLIGPFVRIVDAEKSLLTQILPEE